ncbi:tumor necrosis factor ligand superfamily member 18 [Ochotona princeps]|uniref:tumor necrosis factor ligand superfamily member 18 n=1 Tax=Ochotona princeps TaxID=9978 RepID=UPI002714638C|nr:tumor necrosis factor ligand superfamily member 18 [Ochotona princeps]
MESMPGSHSSQGPRRASWKLWLLCSTLLLLLLCCLSTLILTLMPLKMAKDPCVAKFGPSPSEWQMASSEPSCLNKMSDWKLRILQNGLYAIYGRVTPNPTYKGFAPFEVQLCKNKDAIQTLTDSSKIQNLGNIYEFNAGDTIELRFNSDDQVLKTNTYFGIILLANPQFGS